MQRIVNFAIKRIILSSTQQTTSACAITKDGI